MTADQKLDLILATLKTIESKLANQAVQQVFGNAPAVGADGLPTTLPPYGKAKGQSIAGASKGDLDYYIKGCRRTLDDPGKSKFHAKERLMLKALEAELAKGGGSSEPDDFGPPPPDSEPLPF